MPDIFSETVHAFEHAFRHFEHPGEPQPVVARERVIPFAPQSAAAPCGQCQEGLVVAGGCTCGGGLPPYGHEPLCGLEPCPNGCWDILHPPFQAPAPQPVNLGTTLQEEPVSVVTDLQNFAHELAAKAAELEQTVLPAAAGHLAALEGNPVVDSLLNAVHVPPEALAIVVATIQGLEELYKPTDAVPAAPAQ